MSFPNHLFTIQRKLSFLAIAIIVQAPVTSNEQFTHLKHQLEEYDFEVKIEPPPVRTLKPFGLIRWCLIYRLHYRL